jgi:hypothetical protein
MKDMKYTGDTRSIVQVAGSVNSFQLGDKKAGCFLSMTVDFFFQEPVHTIGFMKKTGFLGFQN